MKAVRFHPVAIEEAAHQRNYYEQCQRGLGIRFVNELEQAVQRVRTNPSIFRIVRGKVRKCRLRCFPHGLLFMDKTDCIYIIAVMHLHREPGYWKNRC